VYGKFDGFVEKQYLVTFLSLTVKNIIIEFAGK